MVRNELSPVRLEEYIFQRCIVQLFQYDSAQRMSGSFAGRDSRFRFQFTQKKMLESESLIVVLLKI